MLYAMILQNRVIGIVRAEVVPSWPPDSQGNPVTAIKCDDTVKLGMIYNPETGEFIEYIPSEPPEPEPTQLDRIETLVSTSYIEAQNAAVDAYTEELLEGGIL